MVELVHGLSTELVRTNLERVREAIADTGRDPDEIEVLAAVKYVPVEELAALAEAGATIVGENRAQELVIKTQAGPGGLTWDFIGHLQSRKVRDVVPLVRYIHSVCTDSVLDQLGRHASPETEVLVEVNVAGEEGKSGIAPDQLASFLERCPVTRRRPDDDAAIHREARGEPALLRDAGRAGRRPRTPAPVDGDQPGLPGRRRGGGDNCAPGYNPLPRRVIITSREIPPLHEPLRRNGLPRHMAQDARLFRPR